MGQSNSTERKKLNAEQISVLFAQRCGKQFSSLEIWSLKAVVKELADKESAIEYWKEETLLKYLGIPDSVAPAGSLIFRSASFLAAFPFIRRLSPGILTVENFVKVLAFYNGKYKGVMKGEYDWVKLIFLSFAIEEDGDETKGKENKEAAKEEELIEKDGEEFEMTDILSSSSWDQFSVVQNWDELIIDNWYIEGNHLVALFSLLLALVDFKPYEMLGDIAERFSENKVKELRKSAQSMVRSITDKSNSKVIEDLKITYEEFKVGVIGVFPNALDPLGFLFDQLLYQQKVIVNKEGGDSEGAENGEEEGKVERDKNDNNEKIEDNGNAEVNKEQQRKESSTTSFHTPNITTKQTTRAIRGQLYSMLGPMINSMVKLYSGSEAGFSMRSFETRVFNWQAPTILIVSGRRITEGGSNNISNSRIHYFNDLIPPVRARNTRKSKRVVFGAYIETPWRANSKECFSNDNSTKLFQLYPTQNVYKPSFTNRNYAYFTRGEGVGFGSLPPQNNKYKSIGNISLIIESSFELGLFRHFGQGGSFEPGASNAEKVLEYEDRFSIDEIEVWGCGTEEHLAEQRLRWEWEEREALNRQRINVNSLGEDRALLEMAGLVGKYSQSGGSM